MKSKLFSKAGVISAAIVLIAVILLVSPQAKGFLFGTAHRTEPHTTEATTAEYARETKNGEPAAADYPPAPSVVFKDGAGKTIDISRQKGKVLFINFWATWCPPCVQEMPSINKLRKQLNEKDILFLMVDVDGNYKKSSRFMKNNNYDLPVYTPESAIPPTFLSGAIPTTVIIDKAGKVVGRHEGGADYMHPEIVKFFKELTGK